MLYLHSLLNFFFIEKLHVDPSNYISAISCHFLSGCEERKTEEIKWVSDLYQVEDMVLKPNKKIKIMTEIFIRMVNLSMYQTQTLYCV